VRRWMGRLKQRPQAVYPDSGPALADRRADEQLPTGPHMRCTRRRETVADQPFSR
jgi:hypothetical protein